MHVHCPQCERQLDYSGEAPRFCSFCGATLNAFSEQETAPFAPAADGSAPAEMPQRIGPYRLIRELGQGGMGVVWEAEQEATGRRVALKLLLPQFGAADEAVERFIREAQLAARLSHPRTTFVLGAGEHDGIPFIAMELVEGETLKDLLHRELPAVTRAVDYILDVIEGLAAAHALGIIHRDLKPSNCFLDADGRVKVGDFGLSKSLVKDTTALTRTGAFMGTPQFAAPEQVRGEPVDQRTDVYAVGATLYTLLTGKPPFDGDAVAVIAQIVSESPPSVRSHRREIPAALASIVHRAMARDPARRYTDLAQLRQALTPFASRGTSIADLSLRVAAFMTDVFLCGIAKTVLASPFLGTIQVNGETRQLSTAAAAEAVVGVLWVLYFVLAEGVWGCSPGKLLLGLRVLDSSGNRIGLPRAALRSLFVPAVFFIPLVGQWCSARYPESAWTVLFVGMVLLQSPFPIFNLICMASARRRNGYRGLHEFASGSRTVRVRAIPEPAARIDLPVVEAEAVAEYALGNYMVVGRIGAVGAGEIRVAEDRALRRSVWIFPALSASLTAAPARRAIGRPTRLRWLDQGGSEDDPWEAYEAIEGAPLSDVGRANPKLPWSLGRFLLRDLLHEICDAAADQTLPADLGMSHIWVERGNRLRVLDAALVPSGSKPSAEPGGEGPAAATDGPLNCALDTARAVAELVTRNQVLPAAVAGLLESLRRCPARADALDEIASRAADLCEHRVEVSRAERIAALSISAGLEFAVYLLLGLVWPFVALLVPVALGVWFRGGPAFRFVRMRVALNDGREASKLRLGLRTLVCWGPLLVPMGGFGIALLLQMVRAPISTPVFVIVLVSLLVGLVSVGLGGVYAVVRPRRGLQDLICGTRLVPDDAAATAVN